MPPLPARRLGRFLYFVAWVPVASLLATVLHYALGTPSLEAAALALPAVALLALICVAAQYPARALPVDRTPPFRLVSTHLAGAAVMVAIWLAILRMLVEAFGRWASLSTMGDDFGRQLPLLAGFGVLVYLLAVTFYDLLHASERSRTAERRALEHELHAREAELKFLRAQIDPHFLFNSLNSIAGLIRSDPALAQSLTVRLGNFLRSGLKLGALDLVRLDDELGLAHDFLAVEQARFGARLRVVETIEPEALACTVPPLILQPLLENAVNHGIARLVQGGDLRLDARLLGPRLKISVENDRDADGAPRKGTGLGLANVRRRLSAVYGDAAVLALREDGGRFTAEITVPVRGAGAGGEHRSSAEAPPAGAQGANTMSAKEPEP